jgi:hypothetical protein
MMSTPFFCLYLALGVNNRMSTPLSNLYLPLGVDFCQLSGNMQIKLILIIV